MPEVDALAAFLRERAVGAVVADVELASFAVLKTYDPPVSSLAGLQVTDVRRHGKFLDLDVDGLHLVVHLAKAGWLRWSDQLTDKRLKMGNGPLAARVRLDHGDGPHVGFDLTEAGTRKGLAVYVVRDPQDVEGIAALGPDPMVDGFTVAPLLEGRRMQVKRFLRDQKIVAGIGNAYSDEILHAAKMSPFKPAGTLEAEELTTLYAALRSTLGAAVDRSRGLAASELKGEKKSNLAVHGRTGQACPVCGDTVREVSFADSSLQYCPTCQTGGKPLADRRMSRLLK